MHEVLVILQPVSLQPDGEVRREYRPGAIVNADERTAERLIRQGVARRLIQAAPLFVDATDASRAPKRRQRKD